MARQFQKMGIDIKSLSEGEVIEGTFTGVGHIDASEKHPGGLPYIQLKLPDEAGTIIGLWLTGGLKGKMNLCRVQQGMYIRITHLGKKPFGEFEVNDYLIEISQE
jgi:hypothetical protein